MTQEKKPEPPDPKVVEALRAVVEEEHEGWTLVEASAEHFRAERSGTFAAQVASTTADGLVRALLSHEQRGRESNPDWITLTGPPIVHDVDDVDEEQQDEEGES